MASDSSNPTVDLRFIVTCDILLAMHALSEQGKAITPETVYKELIEGQDDPVITYELVVTGMAEAARWLSRPNINRSQHAHQADLDLALQIIDGLLGEKKASQTKKR